MELIAAPGTLLVASPDMLDQNFMHTVVLICRHESEGAFGLVVNRRIDLTLDTLLDAHPRLSRVPFPVHWGGPVGLDTLQLLHRAPEALPGGVEIVEGLHLGADLDDFAEFTERDREGAEKHVRAMLGYSGWGRKQLERELASGSWLPAPLDFEIIFGSGQQRVWRKALHGIGEPAAGLEDLPPDVTWN